MKTYNIKIQPRGTGKKVFFLSYILVKFLLFVEVNNKKKYFTVKELRDIIPIFLKHEFDNNVIM